MKSITILFFVFISMNQAFASETLRCWANENDPRNHQPYTSEAAWRNDISTWENQNVQVVSPLKLAIAYKVYKSELKNTKLLANDKVVHCVMGCKIMQQTDYKTANFLAWYKEYNDLTDCQKNSNFEFLDYEATVYGADTAARALDCHKTCDDVFHTNQ